MSKHKPGPWEFTENDCGIGDEFHQRYQINGNGYILAVVMTDCESLDNDANARLMASAPELLEALKYARRMVKASECDIAFIDAAIAKALGASHADQA